jgi:AcrR family transcriptional regulator
MSRKRLSSTLRQQQILDTTLDIIAEKGLGGVSTSEIAQRVGIVPSALYRHFESKEALIDALLDRTHMILFENVRKMTLKKSDPKEDLKSLFLLHLEFIRKNPGMPKLVFSDAAVFGSPERKEKVLSIVKNYMNKLTEIAEKGRREGDFLQDISPEAVAFSMVSFVQYVGLISNLSEGKTDIGELAEQAWSYIERGIQSYQAKE